MSEFRHPTRREIFPSWGWQKELNESGAKRFYEDKPPAARVLRHAGEIVYLEDGQAMTNPSGSLRVDEETRLVVDDAGQNADEQYMVMQTEANGVPARLVAVLLQNTVEVGL